MTPAPKASPTLPKVHDDEPPTNPSAPAVHGWVRQVVAEAERAQRKTGIWGLVVLIAAGAVSGFTVKQALAADAKGMVDAGVVPLEKRIAIVEQDARHQSDRLDLVNRKLDVVMDALRVPYDRRPSSDGGQ